VGNLCSKKRTKPSAVCHQPLHSTFRLIGNQIVSNYYCWYTGA